MLTWLLLIQEWPGWNLVIRRYHSKMAKRVRIGAVVFDISMFAVDVEKKAKHRKQIL